MKAKGNQPYHSREVERFITGTGGRKPSKGKAVDRVADYHLPELHPMTRSGYSSAYPSRMRNGKSGA